MLNFYPETVDENLLLAFNQIDPITEDITKLKIALNKEQKLPDKIDKKIVHKTKEENVIISQQEKHKNIWYFNMIPTTKEFAFDHPSDHIQGILITEAIRQCGIATTHLCGLHDDGKIILSNLTVRFNSHIEQDHPIILRAFSRPVIFDKKYFNQYVLVNLIQFGKICAHAIIEGIAFKRNEDLISYREKSIRINKKIQSKYNSLLKNFNRD